MQCGERVVGGKAPEASQSFANRRCTGRFVIGRMTMLYGQQKEFYKVLVIVSGAQEKYDTPHSGMDSH